jgi:hypothetical protein
MNWILDHLQLIFVVGGAIAWWLNQRRQAQTGEEAPPPPDEATFDDPDLAERTRKIREEIQRKIEQRARGYANEQPKVPQLEPDLAELPPVIREVVVARQPSHATSRFDAQRQAEILEQQAALMEKLREAELMKSATKRRTEFEESTADHTAEARVAVRSTVLDDLRTPAALRRAFILREVLGPPVALRR